MMKWLCLISISLFPFLTLFAQALPDASMNEAATSEEEAWVEETFQSLTPKQRIGQLMMLRAHTDKGIGYEDKVAKLIEKYQLGGVCFFQGTPERQVKVTNRYQRLVRVPLMVAQDAEWGLGMRLKSSTISFPRQLMLGAIQENTLIYDMGREIARQCRRIGVHVNFAPVADVNNNPANPVINTRSFGEDRYNVAAKSYMYMKGMEDHGLMACAKHFPGHGDTDTDSHYDLPLIPHDKNRLDSIELFPFRVLAEHNIGSMMIAHMAVPTLDDTPNLPTTLSKPTVTDLLKKQIGYNGLLFTDGLDMKGVTKHHKYGEIETKALRAGNDVLLLPKDVAIVVKTIEDWLEKGLLSQAELDEKVRRILRAKYRLGLHRNIVLKETDVRAELNTPEAYALKNRLIQNALTLVRNPDGLIPIKETVEQKMATLALGATSKTVFQEMLGKYANLKHFNAGKKISTSTLNTLLNDAAKYDVVFVSLHDMSSYASKKFGLSNSQKDLVRLLSERTKVILTVFGSPYSLKDFDMVDHVLVSYTEDEASQKLSAQGLFGAFSFRGRLPVTASPKSAFGQGVTTSPLFRLGYANPEEVNLDPTPLKKIDKIAQDAVRKKATPGCVVLVAKDGKVVWNKAYGYHTYSKKQPMKTTDVFDLASVTKVMAATLSVMKLHETGDLSIYQPISNYLPELAGTNKANLTLYDIMSHRAGLKAWIPFFQQTVDKRKRPSKAIYKSSMIGNYTVPVTEKLFMIETWRDSIWHQIIQSDLRSNTDYKYSDLGFYLISRIVEQVSGKPLDQFAHETFYEPLGLEHTTFNAWRTVDKNRIVPSEKDKYWRQTVVKGYVHDMGAAMLGGVSGHAGLFSTSQEVAIVMQMLLNGGYYGGKTLLKPETVRTFLSRHQADSRRGIGFDMKELNWNRSQNMSAKASPLTFGHLGFTGICVWVDPAYDLTYVFLSNRTYPSMKNFKLSKDDYRPRIQDAIYEAIGVK